MRTNKPAPLWACVIAAADAWHVAPHTIAGGTSLEWFWRWQAYREEMDRAPKHG